VYGTFGDELSLVLIGFGIGQPKPKLQWSFESQTSDGIMYVV